MVIPHEQRCCGVVILHTWSHHGMHCARSSGSVTRRLTRHSHFACEDHATVWHSLRLSQRQGKSAYVVIPQVQSHCGVEILRAWSYHGMHQVAPGGHDLPSTGLGISRAQGADGVPHVTLRQRQHVGSVPWSHHRCCPSPRSHTTQGGLPHAMVLSIRRSRRNPKGTIARAKLCVVVSPGADGPRGMRRLSTSMV